MYKETHQKSVPSFYLKNVNSLKHLKKNNSKGEFTYSPHKNEWRTNICYKKKYIVYI